MNGYLKEISGADLTSKDSATLAGTVLAARALFALEPFSRRRGTAIASIRSIRTERSTMKLHLLGIVLLAASAAACAQPQSGSNIGANTGGGAAANVPAPLPVPSTGTSADAAGTQGTSPRSPETSVGTSGVVGTADTAGRSSGRCDTLIGEERAKCLREQAATGTTGPASTGVSPGATR